jgi:hypothetical protein
MSRAQAPQHLLTTLALVASSTLCAQQPEWSQIRVPRADPRCTAPWRRRACRELRRHRPT